MSKIKLVSEENFHIKYDRISTFVDNVDENNIIFSSEKVEKIFNEIKQLLVKIIVDFKYIKDLKNIDYNLDFNNDDFYEFKNEINENISLILDWYSSKEEIKDFITILEEEIRELNIQILKNKQNIQKKEEIKKEKEEKKKEKNQLEDLYNKAWNLEKISLELEELEEFFIKYRRERIKRKKIELKKYFKQKLKNNKKEEEKLEDNELKEHIIHKDIEVIELKEGILEWKNEKTEIKEDSNKNELLNSKTLIIEEQEEKEADILISKINKNINLCIKWNNIKWFYAILEFSRLENIKIFNLNEKIINFLYKIPKEEKLINEFIVKEILNFLDKNNYK